MGLFKYVRTDKISDWYEEDTDEDAGIADRKICQCEHCGKSFILHDAINDFNFCDLEYTDICTFEVLCAECAEKMAEEECPEYPNIE